MKIMVNDASRLLQPFVRRCREQTVVKVDSIGFVVRKRTPALGRKVAESQQHLAVFLQALDPLWKTSSRMSS